MIAVPWFKFPWTVVTADLAHDLATRARDGDAEARGAIDEIRAHAAQGNKHAKRAWAHFEPVIQLVAAGQPPPSVILQLRPIRVGFNGGFPGGIPSLPWGYQSIWNYGFDPFVFEELQANLDAEVGQNPAGFRMMFNPPTWPSAVGEPLPGEIEYEYEVGANESTLVGRRFKIVNGSRKEMALGVLTIKHVSDDGFIEVEAENLPGKPGRLELSRLHVGIANGDLVWVVETRVGQFPLGVPGGVPLLPFGFGPFGFRGDDGGGEYLRGGPGMSEDIELEDRYI